MQRIEQEKIAREQESKKIAEAETKARSQKTRGILPKGFETPSESEPPKTSRGTLPKGF